VGNGIGGALLAPAAERLTCLQLTEALTDDGGHKPEARLGRATEGRRATLKRATERALREAALRLVSERGYEATSTDDIARAAGVSPRTFFNYFPTKDAVVFLPEDLLPALVAANLRARPSGEDPVASMAAAVMQTFVQMNDLVGPEAATFMRVQLRLVFTEPEVRRITFERRMKIEDAAWRTLQERGVAAEDLAARATVATVSALTFLGLMMWAASENDEPLLAVLSRCLLAAPHPSRLAAGVTAPRPGR
jgi:AcrR family transcriptional regulator